MQKDRVMRMIVMFDMPQHNKVHRKQYRKFSKFLASEGYIMIQFSIYCKICISSYVVNRQKQKLDINRPRMGDVRILVITESQFLSMFQLIGEKSLQEKITSRSRLLIIGGMDDN